MLESGFQRKRPRSGRNRGLTPSFLIEMGSVLPRRDYHVENFQK